MKVNGNDNYHNKIKSLQHNTVYIWRKNPLLVLTEHSEFNKPGFITLSEETRQTVERILGNQDLSLNRLPIWFFYFILLKI